MLTGGSTSIRAFEPLMREAGAAARALLSHGRGGALERELGGARHARRLRLARQRPHPLRRARRGGGGPRAARQSAGPRRARQPARRPAAAAARRARQDRRLGDVRRRRPPARHGLCGGAGAGRRGAGSPRSTGQRPTPSRARSKCSRIPAGPAVAATNWWAAARALDALAPRFHVPDNLPTSASISAALAAALDSDDGDRCSSSGDMAAGFPGASPIEARYEVGLAPSAAIEPLTATAARHRRPASRSGRRPRRPASPAPPPPARSAGRRARSRSIRCSPAAATAASSRRTAIEQAAILAVRLDRPVQLTWPRIQEIQRDSFRPAAAAKMTGWMSQQGLIGWLARIAAPATSAEVAERLGAAGWLVRPDGAAVAGAEPPYGIANCRDRPCRRRSRHPDRHVAPARAQLHLLFHRMLHRRARPRRRARAACRSGCRC